MHSGIKLLDRYNLTAFAEGHCGQFAGVIYCKQQLLDKIYLGHCPPSPPQTLSSLADLSLGDQNNLQQV